MAQRLNDIIVNINKMENNITFLKIDEEHCKCNFGTFTLILNKKGQINVSKLCALAKTSNGESKQFPHWKQLGESKKIIKSICNTYLFNESLLFTIIISRCNEIKGTYAYPSLVTHIAMWAFDNPNYFTKNDIEKIIIEFNKQFNKNIELYDFKNPEKVKNNDGMIYCITGDFLNMCKLGCYGGPYKDLMDRYGTYYGDLAGIVGYCDNYKECEKSMHETFGQYRIKFKKERELFHKSQFDEYILYIKNNCDGFDMI